MDQFEKMKEKVLDYLVDELESFDEVIFEECLVKGEIHMSRGTMRFELDINLEEFEEDPDPDDGEEKEEEQDLDYYEPTYKIACRPRRRLTLV